MTRSKKAQLSAALMAKSPFRPVPRTTSASCPPVIVGAGLPESPPASEEPWIATATAFALQVAPMPRKRHFFSSGEPKRADAGCKKAKPPRPEGHRGVCRGRKKEGSAVSRMRATANLSPSSLEHLIGGGRREIVNASYAVGLKGFCSHFRPRVQSDGSFGAQVHRRRGLPAFSSDR